MLIRANPERGKSEEEKKAAREKFRYGDNVLPKLRRRGGEGDEEERRVIESVQALSLREVGIETGGGSSGRNTLEPPRERSRRERSADRPQDRSQDTRRSADHVRSHSRNPSVPSSSREVVPPRVVEHQSSLRSLLSASELDSQEMEEEIMRQIMEDGLLDGIDLNNIDVAQEDEISERIAQAYRTRRTERHRERRERRERLARDGQIAMSGHSTPEVRSPPVREEEQARRRPHMRSESGPSTPRDRDHRPPVSRPGLLDVANQGGRMRRNRSSSQGSTRSARSERRPAPISVSSARGASTSQTDLSSRPATAGMADTTRRRQSDNQQRITLEERQQFRNNIQTHSSSNPNSPRRSAFNVPTTTASPTSSAAVVPSPLSSPLATTPSATLSQPPSFRRTTDPTGTRHVRPSHTGTPPMTSPPEFTRSTTDPSVPEPRSRPTSVAATIAPVAPTLYPEPHITCRSCNKDHIEYDLHYNCSRCDDGTYNLCQPCYRAKKGCKHWYGFGWAAWPHYQKQAPPGGYPPSHEYPHILRGHKYRRPLDKLTESVSTPGSLVSEDDPDRRLEAGVFCDICSTWANACYWKCDYCNEGEWGYCNDCVNQGRHCTHALLPITHVGKDHTPPCTSTTIATDPQSSLRPDHLAPPFPLDSSPPTTPPLTPRAASLIGGPGQVTLVNSTFRPLTFTTLCNICTYPIPPSHTRYHCSTCNGGDYDICKSCYKKLVVSGRISTEDGIQGWRRCLRGHRMVVVGFEDRDGGQRRVVVRDLVGGLSLRDNDTSNTDTTSPIPPSHQQRDRPHDDKWTWRDIDGSRQQTHHHHPQAHTDISSLPSQQKHTRYPPDGGVGLRVQARWSYFPAEEVTDELRFPRFAEIREAEDINGDWFWGVYAGAKGLFPGNYGRVVGGNVERGGVI
jgi:hypothetical protein